MPYQSPALCGICGKKHNQKEDHPFLETWADPKELPK